MTAIAFAPKHNTPGKRDATGAFIPCATRWAEYWDGKLVLIDNHQSKAKQRAAVLDAADGFFFGRIAFFCHGLPRSLGLGFDLSSVAELAKVLTGSSCVTLFACSTGADEVHGFAARLRDELCRCGADNVTVDSHTTAGHTTENPYVRRFADYTPRGGDGGQWIVAPGSALWPKWRAALKLSAPGGLWLRFSDMNTWAIHEEVSK